VAVACSLSRMRWFSGFTPCLCASVVAALATVSAVLTVGSCGLQSPRLGNHQLWLPLSGYGCSVNRTRAYCDSRISRQ